MSWIHVCAVLLLASLHSQAAARYTADLADQGPSGGIWVILGIGAIGLVSEAFKRSQDAGLQMLAVVALAGLLVYAVPVLGAIISVFFGGVLLWGIMKGSL